MKRIKFFLISVFIVLLFTTCKKDDPDVLPPGITENSVYNVTYTSNIVEVRRLPGKFLLAYCTGMLF